MLRDVDRFDDRCKPIETRQPGAKLPDARRSHLHGKMGSTERPARRQDRSACLRLAVAWEHRGLRTKTRTGSVPQSSRSKNCAKRQQQRNRVRFIFHLARQGLLLQQFAPYVDVFIATARSACQVDLYISDDEAWRKSHGSRISPL